jgi:hypothetical protein
LHILLFARMKVVNLRARSLSVLPLTMFIEHTYTLLDDPARRELVYVTPSV